MLRIRLHRFHAAICLLMLALPGGMLASTARAQCLGVLPTIEAVTPDPVASGATVTIVGTFFQPPPCLEDVTVGGVSSPAYAWVNYETIIAVVPALTEGVHGVRVHINFGGTSDPYFIEVAEPPPPCDLSPNIANVDPPEAPSYAQVTIEGSDFQPPPCLLDVRFGGESSPEFAWLDANTILATVPDLPDGPVPIEVEQLGGTDLYNGFEVANGFICLAVLPQISAVTPSSAPALAVVTVSGAMFQPPPCLKNVSFGGVNSPAIVWVNGNTILATVPNLLPGTSAPVRVHINVGGTSPPFPFTVGYPCPGDVIADGVINVNDLVAVITVWGTDDPDGDQNGDGVVDVNDLVLVIVNWGPCCSEVPVITEIEPDPSAAGGTITITGTGFEPQPCLVEVTFDDVPSPFIALVDETTIVADVPELTGTVDVVVVQAGGASAPVPLLLYDDVICLAAHPEITDVSPGGARVGEEVTLTGINFQGEPCLYAVTFGGEPSLEFEFTAPDTITATVPPRPVGPAPIQVHCHVGGSSDPYYFVVLPP